MKNKLYGILLILIGVISAPITKDISFLLFTIPAGLALATCKTNIFEEEY